MEGNRDIKDIKYNYKKERKRKRASNKNHKIKMDNVRDFFQKNGRYFIAAILFALLVVIVAFFTNPKTTQVGNEIREEDQNLFKENAYEDVNQLVAAYYDAYANGNLEAIDTLATPVSEREKGYIKLFSQYVESYQNIICYTKQGLDEKSYLVNVYVDVKFIGVDTLAPGLDFFYVRTAEDGTLYIDNLYSQYNYRNMDNALDTEIDQLIQEFEHQEDVIALLNEVQLKFDEAVVADENLANVLHVTIPEAISDWMAEIVAENTNIPEETTETVETEVVEPEPEVSETVEPEEPKVEGFPEGTVITIEETINIREGMSTETKKVGTAYKGEKVTVIMSYAEGWTKVKWKDKTGYIRTDLLQ